MYFHSFLFFHVANSICLERSFVYSMSTHSYQVNYFSKGVSLLDGDTQWMRLQPLQYEGLKPHDSTQTLRIIVFSDTHGAHEMLGKLPPCDILIFCGNILLENKNMTDKEAKERLEVFNNWIGQQHATHKVIIAGNHDRKLEELQSRIFMSGIQQIFTNAAYLCNNSIFVDKLNIVGIPFSLKESGTQASNKAFQSKEAAKQTEDFLNYMIEKDTKVDILITHGLCENIGGMLKPRLGHFSGNAKDYYGVRRVMYAPIEIEGINHRSRTRNTANGGGMNDLYSYHVVSTIVTPEEETSFNLPIVFDCPRPDAVKLKHNNTTNKAKGTCIIL